MSVIETTAAQHASAATSMGPSGSGKLTLMHILAGIDIVGQRAAVVRLLGAIHQD
jgi:ABC-type lipoprotein export system ATPase subunit